MKQIEEMAKVMLEASTSANVEPVLEMEGKEVVLGENATKILNNILEQAYIPFLAEVLYNAGYRKQADVENYIPLDVHECLKQRAVEIEKVEVAREIFEEIEKEVAPKIPMKIQPIFKDDRDFEGGFINGKTDALIDVLVLIAELKKKYTEAEEK